MPVLLICAAPTGPRAFAAPADVAPDVLAQAEALWTTTLLDAAAPLDPAVCDAPDDALAVLLCLGPGDGHDELTRCDAAGCDAWFWADQGATVAYESGRELTVCAAHAQADDPGARIYPGAGLAAAWQDHIAADYIG